MGRISKKKQRYVLSREQTRLLVEMYKNLQSLSMVEWEKGKVGVSDTGTPVGEYSTNAKYTNNTIMQSIDLRLSGNSLKTISQKMDIPVRTLRDYFSGKRRAVMPIRFKQRSSAQSG